MIAVLGSAMITGRPFTVYRDGAAAHDYVYVDDVVDAFVRAGCAPMKRPGPTTSAPDSTPPSQRCTA